MLLILSVITVDLSHASDATENRHPKNVLILHSFHKGQGLNVGIAKGIESVFNTSGYSFQLFYEYMDSKRIFDNTHLENLFLLLQHKFAVHKLDAIITTEDPAFRFMLNYSSRLSPKTPVVFCGVNYFEKFALYGQKNFTGVLEVIDIEDTLDIALSINPDVKKAFIIVDKTPTSVAIIQSFLKILGKYSDRLSMYFTEDLTMEDLIDRVGTLSTDTIAIIANFTIDRAGNVFSRLRTAHA